VWLADITNSVLSSKLMTASLDQVSFLILVRSTVGVSLVGMTLLVSTIPKLFVQHVSHSLLKGRQLLLNSAVSSSQAGVQTSIAAISKSIMLTVQEPQSSVPTIDHHKLGGNPVLAMKLDEYQKMSTSYDLKEKRLGVLINEELYPLDEEILRTSFSLCCMIDTSGALLFKDALKRSENMIELSTDVPIMMQLPKHDGPKYHSNQVLEGIAEDSNDPPTLSDNNKGVLDPPSLKSLMWRLTPTKIQPTTQDQESSQKGGADPTMTPPDEATSKFLGK
jgi:hypothetical protein